MAPREAQAWREPHFTDGEGRKWHVCDVARIGGRRRNVGLGSLRATHRVFVAEDGAQLACQIANGDARQLTAQQLARQLREARNAAAWANTFQPTRRARR